MSDTDSQILIQQLEEYLQNVDIANLLEETAPSSTTSITSANNVNPLKTKLVSIINNTTPPPPILLPQAAITSYDSNLPQQANSGMIPPYYQPMQVQINLEAANSSVSSTNVPSASSSSSKQSKRRKHWQDWKDQMAEQLSKRTEDPNFKIKQCAKAPLKSKPYEKYTSHYKLK